MSLLGRDEEKEKGSGKEYDRDQIDGERILTQKKKDKRKRKRTKKGKRLLV